MNSDDIDKLTSEVRRNCMLNFGSAAVYKEEEFIRLVSAFQFAIDLDYKNGIARILLLIGRFIEIKGDNLLAACRFYMSAKVNFDDNSSVAAHEYWRECLSEANEKGITNLSRGEFEKMYTNDDPLELVNYYCRNIRGH